MTRVSFVCSRHLFLGPPSENLLQVLSASAKLDATLFHPSSLFRRPRHHLVQSSVGFGMVNTRLYSGEPCFDCGVIETQ